jgi:PAS domain S-box-containing protein
MSVLTGAGTRINGYFAGLDLRGKLTAILVAGALLIGGGATALGYLVFRADLIDHANDQLQAWSALERREIELRLGAAVAQAEAIASNTITANALADSVGRETYLAPLMQNQKAAIPGSDLTIVDYRGRPVASSAEAAPDYPHDPRFLRMMANGQKQAGIDGTAGTADAGATLIVALPIHYRLTGAVEGGVVLRVPLAMLLNDSDAADTHGIADATRHIVAGATPLAQSVQIGANLNLPAPVDALGLALVLSRDRGKALGNLDEMLLAVALLGIVVIGGLLLLARVVARHVTASLHATVQAAEEIAATGRPEARLPLQANDEFGRLTAAFNTMVERLSESYADLEARVAARTADLEAARLEAEAASQLLRESVSSIAQGFTIYDQNDRLVHCNEAYLRFYDTSRDLIVPGATFEEIIRRGAERGQYTEAVGRVDEWVRTRVTQHQNANGEVVEQQLTDGRWLLIVEYRTPSGYIVGNRIDITELKQTAQSLRERELYLRATLDNLPFMFWLKDTEGRFLAVNRNFSNACGRDSPEALVGLSDLDVWPQEMAATYRADDREVLSSRQEKCVEEPIAANGGVGWIETFKKPVIGGDGKLLGTVGFARDISERRHLQQAIFDRTEQLNAIFALSPDGFVSFDRLHRVKYVSPAFLHMSGFTEDEVVGLDEAAFASRLAGACVAQASFPGFDILRARLAAVPVGEGEERKGDAAGRRQLIELAGAGKRVLEMGLRLSQAGGQADSVSQILYFRDVTHESEVDQMKSEFLSTAAHELRTPMASIYGFSEVMLAYDFSPEEKREFLVAIHSQAGLMASIVNELLDLARIEARRGKDFKFERVNVRALLREIVTHFKTPDGRTDPVEPAPDGLRWVRADRNKLIQAVNNVLSNAYKYSPGGGSVAIEIIERVEARQGSGQSALTGIRISDQGIGLTPEQLQRVCERFYRADTSGKIPGTGLGMSIVKEIVELHGGEVEISSRFGGGTAVTLWLPGMAREGAPSAVPADGELV